MHRCKNILQVADEGKGRAGGRQKSEEFIFSDCSFEDHFHIDCLAVDEKSATKRRKENETDPNDDDDEGEKKKKEEIYISLLLLIIYSRAKKKTKRDREKNNLERMIISSDFYLDFLRLFTERHPSRRD